MPDSLTMISFLVYPMGLGTSAKSIFVYCCLYLVKVRLILMGCVIFSLFYHLIHPCSFAEFSCSFVHCFIAARCQDPLRQISVSCNRQRNRTQIHHPPFDKNAEQFISVIRIFWNSSMCYCLGIVSKFLHAQQVLPVC